MKKRVSLIALCVLSLTTACILAGCGASLDREIAVEEMTMKVPSNWVETSDEETSVLAISRLKAPSAGAAAGAAEPDAAAGADAASVEAAASGEGAADGSASSADGAQAGADAADGSEAAAAQAIADEPGGGTAPGAAASAAGPGASVTYRDVDEDNEDERNAITVSYLPLAKSPAKTAQEAIALKQLQAEREFGVVNWDIDKEKSSVIDGAQVTKFEYSFEKEIDRVAKKYEYRTVYVFNASMCYEISVYGSAASVDDVVDSIAF